jgi:predicted Ser/Thr protein kinase
MLSGEDLDFQAAIAGQYSIDRELGRGGMGVVYLAREALLDRPVALKRLPLEMAANPDSRERFLREARTAAQLFHPNIVPIHRVSEIDDFVFFAMGYVEGESLGQLVRRRGPLPAQQVARILRDVAFALGYGHSRGVVHRDIKPDNLLYEVSAGRTLVTDFGIAHREGTTALTQDGQMLGSVHYMSPEQISGAAVDGRGDLYALGVVAHFLLTGKPVFDNDMPAAVLGMHLQKEPPPISSVARGVPRRMADAIDRCLVKDPAARFATADAFAEQLVDSTPERTVPPELRTWVKGEGLIDPGIFPIAILTIVGIGYWASGWPLLVPVVYALFQRARVTRNLLGQGYDARDLASAILMEIERSSEEERVQVRPAVSPLARILRIATTILVLGGVVGIAITERLVMGTPPGTPETYIRTLLSIGNWCTIGVFSGILTGLFSQIISPSRSLGRLSSSDLSWRLKFWRSKTGATLARWLKKGSKVTASADRDRPTEVIVGAAAASLYDALPKEIRKELPGVRETVAKLEGRARDLRARREELETLARSAQPLRSTSSATVEDVRRGTVDDLADASEKVGGQLSTTIAALETIRLDLLRLHAGRGSTEDLTAAIAAARAIGDDVESTLAGQQSVERLLRA